MNPALRILVVDDEPDVEMLFRQRFRKELREGLFDISFVLSAEQALQVLEDEKPVQPSLVLSDINMPGMTGLQLLEKVKQEYPELKIVMISAYAQSDYEVKARELGADDFIAKPIDFRHLTERLKEFKR